MNYRFGQFEIHPQDRRLLRDGVELHVQPKTFDTLLLLVEERGHLVSKGELMARLWPDMVVTEHSLTRCIREVRKVLGDQPVESRFIETVPKSGYRFVAEVEAAEDQAKKFARDGDHRHGRQRLLWVTAGLAAVLLGLGAWYWMAPGPNAAGIEPPVLAIPPIANTTGDADYDLVLGGLTEDIRTRLSSSGQLAVNSAGSAAALGEGDRDHSEWPQALNADWLMSGKLIEDDKHQAIAVNLTSAEGGEAWAHTVRISSGDLIGAAEKISSLVAESLELELPPQPRYLATAASVESINAHHQYLMARGLIAQRSSDNLARAITILHQVLELKSDHAGAMAALGIAYILSPDQYYPAGVAIDRADGLFDDALRIDPDLALAWAGKALVRMYLDRPLEEQRRYIERALELNPYDADILAWAATLASSEGRIDDDFDYLSTALAIDPLHVTVSSNLSFNLMRQGRYDQAMELLDNTSARLGDHPSLYYPKVSVAAARGDLRTALEQAQQALLGWPQGMFFAGQLAGTYARLQMRDEAKSWLAHARQMPGNIEQRYNAALRVHRAFGDDPAIGDLMAELLASEHFEDAAPEASAPWLLTLLVTGHGQLQDCASVREYFTYRFGTPQSLQGLRGTFSLVADLAHWMAWCLQRDGRNGKADPWLNRVAEQLSFMKQHGLADSTAEMYIEAQNLLLRGEPEASLAILESMLEIGWLNQGALQHDPRWTQLRGDPRFKDLQQIVSARTRDIRDSILEDGVVEEFQQSLADP